LRPHLWSRPKPEDLVHDALARALDSGLLEHFEDRGPGSLRNLLLRVLDRTILDALRAERAEKRSTNARGSGGDESEAGAIGQHVDRREPSPTSVARSSEWIGLCRSLLAEHEWRVWSAVELEGCTPSEVARMLGLGESSARGILFRARSKILHAFLALEE
jgi:RNA polymerase sigma factor (sigma-70 family)